MATCKGFRYMCSVTHLISQIFTFVFMKITSACLSRHRKLRSEHTRLSSTPWKIFIVINVGFGLFLLSGIIWYHNVQLFARVARIPDQIPVSASTRNGIETDPLFTHNVIDYGIPTESKHAAFQGHEHRHHYCNIPDIDPHDPSIDQLFWHPKRFVCDPSFSLMHVDDNGFLQINQSALRLSGNASFECHYREVVRRPDDANVDFGRAHSLRPPVYVDADYVLVICKDLHTNVTYENLHVAIESRKTLREAPPVNETDEQLSVFIVGIDAVSRLAARRSLPKVYKFLLEELDAVEFRGHTKVGENTFPNLIPAFTGRCTTSKDLPQLDLSSTFMDTYPFIWKNFSKENYVTLHAEDYPLISIFNFLKRGFNKQPSNHYMRPFWLAKRKVLPREFTPKADPTGYVHRIKPYTHINDTNNICYDGKPTHHFIMDYYKRFARNYSGMLRYAFVWLTEIAHDNLNFLELADNDFLSLFTFLHRNGHFDRAVLVFMSDHGSRVEKLRQTFVGRIEDKMPLFIMAIPKMLREKFPHIHTNMKENAEGLTTPYDLYETLVDILTKTFSNQSVPMNTTVAATSTSGSHSSASGCAYISPPGISLFRPIPISRSCSDAGISEHFCSCYKSTSVSVLDPEIRNISLYVVNEINSLLSLSKDKCANLLLMDVLQAERFSVTNKGMSEQGNHHMVTLKTNPGGAIFEATAKVNNKRQIHLLGTISRINRYGNQSDCISNHDSKPYCYCKSLIRK